MAHLEWFLSFAEITFPVFLLIPSLITSFRRQAIPPVELGRLYFGLLMYYLTIILTILCSLGAQGSWVAFVITIISATLVSWSLFYIMRWTLQEQIILLMERLLGL